MAITLQVYNNANSSTKTITFEFASNVLAYGGGTSSQLDYYFTIKTSAKDQDGVAFETQIIRDLSTFPLDTKRRISNWDGAYNSITEMVTDWAYDYLYGHSQTLLTAYSVTTVQPRKGIQF